jgi:hypothetical protein
MIRSEAAIFQVLILESMDTTMIRSEAAIFQVLILESMDTTITTITPIIPITIPQTLESPPPLLLRQLQVCSSPLN